MGNEMRRNGRYVGRGCGRAGAVSEEGKATVDGGSRILNDKEVRQSACH